MPLLTLIGESIRQVPLFGSGIGLGTCITQRLAVEMPTWFKAWCNEYAIDYLDLSISPLHVERDFYFAINTNCETLYERIDSYSVPRKDVALDVTAMRTSSTSSAHAWPFVGNTTHDLLDIMEPLEKLVRATIFRLRQHSPAYYSPMFYMRRPLREPSSHLGLNKKQKYS